MLREKINNMLSQGELKASAPWVLSYGNDKDLDKIVRLAAGAGWFKATEDSFISTINDVNFLTEEELRIKLIESFTRNLCPPQTMAGLLLSTNIHPMWGIRVAHMVKSKIYNHDCDLETLKEVELFIFNFIGSLLDYFSGFNSNEEHFKNWTMFKGEDITPLPQEAQLYVDNLMRPHMFVEDFVNEVLIPAQVFKYTSNDTFTINSDIIKKVRAGNV